MACCCCHWSLSADRGRGFKGGWLSSSALSSKPTLEAIPLGFEDQEGDLVLIYSTSSSWD